MKQPLTKTKNSQRRRPKLLVYICCAVMVVAVLILSDHYAHMQVGNRMVPPPTSHLTELQRRDGLIKAALFNHPVHALAANATRLVSLKHVNAALVNLNNCTEQHVGTATQGAASADFETASFAYVLTNDAAPTDACSLDKVLAAYGKPNQSVVIAGNPTTPKEVLLFYDTGSTATHIFDKNSIMNTVLPVTINNLPYVHCEDGATTISIIAHQDDDLLFLNPAVKNEIAAGNCVRTVYVTAGDAGHGQLYWQSREKGAQAAYDLMTGNKRVWVYRTLQFGSNQYATVINPQGNHKVSLIFLRLPDGQPYGLGNKTTNYESLKKLKSGAVRTLHSVDGRSSFSASSLVNALAALVNVYQPNKILTQTPYQVAGQIQDHSDHIATGEFARQAAASYTVNHPATAITYFLGYPIKNKPENLSATVIADKQATFFAYAQYDSPVCKNVRNCGANAYNYYLRRQYETGDH